MLFAPGSPLRTTHPVAPWGSWTGTATNPATRAQHLLADHLGSTRLMTDAAGNVKQRYDYLPFGEGIPASIGGRTTEMGYLTTPDAIAYVRQMFTGQYRDRENALDYFNVRYYSPQQGRFVSPDPQNAGASPNNPQTWNGYAYVGNNPLNITDPSGEAWWHWVIGGAAAALGFPYFFAAAMASAGPYAITAITATTAAAASAGFGFMVSSSVDAVVNRRPPVIGLFQGGNPSGLFGSTGPFGRTGPADYPWNEDHPALHRTPVDPLMIFDFQQGWRLGRDNPTLFDKWLEAFRNSPMPPRGPQLKAPSQPRPRQKLSWGECLFIPHEIIQTVFRAPQAPSGTTHGNGNEIPWLDTGRKRQQQVVNPVSQVKAASGAAGVDIFVNTFNDCVNR